MIWLLLAPILAFGSDGIITFENLKLRLDGALASCPDLKDLQRDQKMYWAAEGGWRSYNLSFSKSLDRLVGVQWQGDKVGSIFCQYKDKSELTFPVAIHAPGIYLRPDGWVKGEDGSFNCVKEDLFECKFQKVEEVKENYSSEESLFQFLEKIKKGKDDH